LIKREAFFMRTRGLWALSLAATALFSGAAFAQQQATAVAARPAGYDLAREGTIVGTVVSFDPAGKNLPLGAHVVLQTSSGTLDVHLGDAHFLQTNNFSIKSGDTLRVIGETVAYGRSTQFVARVVQDGTRALQVRSVRGLPLGQSLPKSESNGKQGGAQ
jgi:hypothetical protein